MVECCPLIQNPVLAFVPGAWKEKRRSLRDSIVIAEPWGDNGAEEFAEGLSVYAHIWMRHKIASQRNAPPRVLQPWKNDGASGFQHPPLQAGSVPPGSIGFPCKIAILIMSGIGHYGGRTLIP